MRDIEKLAGFDGYNKGNLDYRITGKQAKGKQKELVLIIERGALNNNPAAAAQLKKAKGCAAANDVVLKIVEVVKKAV